MGSQIIYRATPTHDGLMSKLDKKKLVFDPRDYGAVADGSTDDTAAVHACFTAALANTSGRPRCVKFGGGKGTVYKFDVVTLTGTADANCNGANGFEICADPDVLLKATTNGSGNLHGTLFEFKDGQFHDLHIHDLNLLGIAPIDAATGSPYSATQENIASGIGIWIHDMDVSACRLRLHHCTFLGFGQHAIALCDLQAVPNIGEGQELWGGIEIHHLWATDCGTHMFLFAYLGPAVAITDITCWGSTGFGIAGDYTEDGKAYNLCILGRSQVIIDNFNGSGRGGIYVGSTSKAIIRNSSFEHFIGTAIWFAEGSSGTVQNSMLSPKTQEGTNPPNTSYIAVHVGQYCYVTLDNLNLTDTFTGGSGWANGYPVHIASPGVPFSITVINMPPISVWSDADAAAYDLGEVLRTTGAQTVTGHKTHTNTLTINDNTGLRVNSGGLLGGVAVSGTFFPAFTLLNNGTLKFGMGLATSDGGFFTNALTNDAIIRAENGGRLLLGANNAGDNASSAIAISTNGVGFYGHAPTTKQTITGAKGSNAAVASLIAAFVALGLFTDSTSA